MSSEPDSLTESILSSNPTVDKGSSVFRPSWVRHNGVIYKTNNCFLIKDSDGLDPKFVKVEEILVIGNCLLTFIVHDKSNSDNDLVMVAWCDSNGNDGKVHSSFSFLTVRHARIWWALVRTERQQILLHRV